MGKGVAAMKTNKTEYQILSPVFEDCWKIFSAHFPHLPHPVMRIGRNKKTWGICYHYTPARISLSKHLARTTLEFQQHVIFHELCHIIYPNHRREFYDLLDCLRKRGGALADLAVLIVDINDDTIKEITFDRYGRKIIDKFVKK